MNKKIRRERIEELASKIKKGNINTSEQEEFDGWYSEQLKKELYVTEDFASNQTELKNRIYHGIEDNLEFNNNGSSHRLFAWKRIVVAASVLVLLGISFYFVSKQDNAEAIKIAHNQIPNLSPGKNKAVLTLSSGEKIDLDQVDQGQIATEGSSVISMTPEKGIVYADGKHQDKSLSKMNTMSTPRGAQYNLTLTDGTKVWLNAASSITYPTSFSGKNREVSVTGEVYFEVAHDTSRPFKVKSGHQTIEVIGTHFNVNCYDNEQVIRTTLLQGSVAVSIGQFRNVLRPGYQASVNNEGIKIEKVETDEIIAWKEGYFQFMDCDIQTIMRQISRWYDIDVEFTGPESRETFTGRISRDRNINQVLKIVQESKSVHLTYEGGRIMVRQ